MPMQNISIQKRLVEIKMVYASFLFELSDYEAANAIGDEVIDDIMGVFCSRLYVNLPENQEKDIFTDRMWKKMVVVIMINLCSSIHAKDFHNIMHSFDLFGASIKNTSRVGNVIFRKCNTYILDSVGAILKEYKDVTNETRTLCGDLFPNLDKVCI